MLRKQLPTDIESGPQPLLADGLLGDMKRRTFWLIGMSVALGTAAALVCILIAQMRGRERQLGDGSTLVIRDAVVAKELSCTFPHGNPLQQFLGRITSKRVRAVLPQSLRSICFPTGNAGLGLSGDGKVCLFVVTARYHLPAADQLHLKLLVVGDEHDGETNSSPCLVTVEDMFQGWAFEDFPKNTRTLTVRCLASDRQDHLLEAARFTIPNPAYRRRSIELAKPATGGVSTGDSMLPPDLISPERNKYWTVEFIEKSNVDLPGYMARWSQEGWKVRSISKPFPQADGMVGRKTELSR
jgi:hypothetical protein